MSAQPDMLVYSSDKKLVLAVEVRTRRDAPIEWVVELRRNLLVHGFVPSSDYFLLVLPDFMYLWKNSTSSDPYAIPDYRIETRPVLRPHINEEIISLDNISRAGLELVVSICLTLLMNSDVSEEIGNPSLHWFFDSGLYKAAKNGSVLMEAVA